MPSLPTEIFSEAFQSDGLPHGWYTDTALPRYGGGAWDCRSGDGAIIPLPHDAWHHLRVEIDVSDIGLSATAFCGTDNRTALTLSLSDNAARHQAVDGGFVITPSTASPALNDKTLELVFEWTADTMRAGANGVELLSAANLRQSTRAGSFQIGFRDCIVRRIAASGTAMDEIPAPARAIEPGYLLEVTIDFNDDLMACAWTHQTFDALFSELKAWGTQRVSWIDLGRAADGFFDFAPIGIGSHAQQTMRNVGDIFTAAVQHAHQHGIELIGILKPFDMAIQGFSWPPFSHEAGEYGRIQRIGGSTAWATHMAAEHQHLIMARKPSAHGPAKNEVWTRLDLVKDDDCDAAISPHDIAFIVSDDNATFRPYTGPITRHEISEEYCLYRCTPAGPMPTAETRRARVLRFENLEIREPFFAIEVQGSARSFVNRLCDLVHLFGKNGEETHFTYGLLPRRADHTPMFKASPATGSTPTVGPQAGFEYNRYLGTPSSYMKNGGDPINTPLALDRGATSYIAFARGKDRGPLAVLSPSFPETRALWMTWVTAMLDAGADGIDLRPGHHHADFAWGEYGFEEPVRDEMLKRTGVDIRETDDFDYEMWRRIRGEGWTQFVREASAVVRGRGKKFIVHIDEHFDNAPGLGGAMNIVTDWRSWLEEDLIDRVTGKALWPGASFSREVLELAHAKGVPVSYAPYCNNFFEDRSSMNHTGDSPLGCEVPVARLIEWGKASGYDSFLFYECAAALRAAPDGTVGFRPNAALLRDVMQRHFKRP